MVDVHITFPLTQFHAMLTAFEEQFAAQQDTVVVLDCGSSCKQMMGYIVLEWNGEVDPDFLDQLTGDSNVIDFSVYTVPCITDDQLYALELAES